MRLVHTLVKSVGFHDLSTNPLRLELLDRLLAGAVAERADLLILPGGYLFVPDELAVEVAVADVAQRAAKHQRTVIGDIDSVALSADELPYFGFATVGPQPVWRQTSTTGPDAWNVADADVPGAGWVVSVAGSRVAVLVCGELFSERARQSLAALTPDLVVDLGHKSMGSGLTPAMESISRNGGCAVAHSQHVVWWDGPSLHHVHRNGVRESVPLSEARWVGDDEFWIGWAVREIG